MRAQSASTLLQDLPLAAAYLYIKTLGAKTLPLLFLACRPRVGRRWLPVGWAVLIVLGMGLCALVNPAVVQSALITAGVLAYDLVASLGFYSLRSSVRAGAVRKDALFCLLAVVFVFVPAPLLRNLGASELLVIGWSVTLSAYSYCVESSRPQGMNSLRDYLFFVLVDPVTSFPDRSRSGCFSSRAIVARVAKGSGMLLAGQQIVQRWPSVQMVIDPTSVALGRAAGFVLAALGAFLAMYLVRAGSAHVRIGLMQSIGYLPPECFVRPYWATSPVDFWRRWNVWVGVWVRRYLFAPLALHFVRKVRGWSAPLRTAFAQMLAVVIAFVAMGLLHDWLIFCNAGRTDFVYVRIFFFGAVGLLAWEAVARTSARFVGASAAENRLFSLAGRACTAGYVAVMLSIAGTI